jgi:hypothetical protein
VVFILESVRRYIMPVLLQSTFSPQHVQVLSSQTINGVPVDVLQVTGWVNRPAQETTFYLDRQSFLLRGFRITVPTRRTPP